MKKALILLVIFLSSFFFLSSKVKADSCGNGYNCSGGCTQPGQCSNNKTCVIDYDKEELAPTGGDCGSSQIGGVTPPGKIATYNALAGGTSTSGIGILMFASKLINLFAIICGIWSMFNFLYAGYTYIINQYDTKAQQEIKDRLTMTVIGLVIIVSAYMAAGLVGLIFFGDATFILQPKLQGAIP